MMKVFLKGRKMKKDNKGFTLVELIVVIAILAVLAVALTPKLTQYLDKAKQATDKEIVKTVYKALEAAVVDEDSFSTMQSDYKTGADIFAAVPSGGIRKLIYTNTNNTYSCSAVPTGASEFEKQLYTIIGKNMTFKSKQMTAGTNKMIITVTDQTNYSVVCQDKDGNTFLELKSQ